MPDRLDPAASGIGLQQARHDGPQRHGVDGLVQEMMAGRLGLAQTLRRHVAADQEGRDRTAERVAKLGDGVDARAAILQVKIGNDQVRRGAVEFRQRLGDGLGGDHAAAPVPQQPARSFERQRIVIDDHDELAAQRVGRCSTGSGAYRRTSTRRHLRHQD